MPKILCFGEILWDFLPDALYPGGAPFNVAYHLHQRGADAKLISALGRDVLGEELLRRLRHWGVDTSLLCRHRGLPTGTVIASLGKGGDASYEITTSVAWDQIFITEDVIRTAMGAQAFVFGSLALRTPFNRNALDRVLAVLPDTALRVFDVNLRPPHDDLALVRELAPRVTLLKLNAAEAARLAAGTPETPGQEESHARALAASSGGAMVCITAGERGAGLLRNDVWSWEDGRAVTVADTVGSGDAFLASLVCDFTSGLLEDQPLLARACRLGEWVATRRGATPPYGPDTPL
jgi:fructokinase